MKKKMQTVLLPLLALCLELIPSGVVMRFANPEGEPWLEKTSYFDLLPMGYGNLFPLLTGLLTLCILGMLVLWLVRGGKGLLGGGAVLCGAGALLSLGSLLFGAYTLIGGGITLALAAEAFLLKRTL